MRTEPTTQGITRDTLRSWRVAMLARDRDGAEAQIATEDQLLNSRRLVIADVLVYPTNAIHTQHRDSILPLVRIPFLGKSSSFQTEPPSLQIQVDTVLVFASHHQAFYYRESPFHKRLHHEKELVRNFRERHKYL